MTGVDTASDAAVMAPASGRWWTTAVTSLAAMLMTLDITVVNVALPRIGAELGSSLDGLQWVVNAYVLAFAALLLTAGSLSDSVGRRTIFLAGVAVFTLASALCAAAPTTGALVAARAVQGLGGAMVLGTSLALIAGAYDGAPARARSTAIGVFTAGGAVAAALGPLVGGSVVQFLDWRFLFVINVPLGLLILLATWRRVPAGAAPEGGGRIDPVGAVLAVLALFALNYGLLAGPDRGWSSWDVVLALAAGTVLAAAFVVVQWRLGERAMLDLRLFTIRSFTGAMLLSFASRIVSFGMLPFIILWLSGVLGRTPLQVGLILLAQSVALVLAAPLGGVLRKVLPVSGLMAVGMALTGAGILLAVRIGPGDGWPAILPTLFLVGAGAGLVLPQLLGLAVAVVPAARAGTASGATNSFFPLGTAVGVAAFGAVVSARVTATLSPAALSRIGVPAGAAAPVRRLVAAGQFGTAAGRVPAAARHPLLGLARLAYTDALSTIFLVAGIAGLLAAVGSLVLVRAKDLDGVADD